MAISIVLTSLVTLWSASGTAEPAFCHDGAAAELPEEALAAWRRFRDRARRLQGVEAIRVVEIASEPRLTREWYIEYKQADKRSMLLYETRFDRDFKEDTSANLFVTNPEYGFTLVRPSPDRPWAFSGINRTPGRDKQIRPPGMPSHMSVEKSTTLPITFYSIFPTIEVSPDNSEVTIDRVTHTTKESESRVRIQFSHVPGSDKPRVPSITGWAEYDPAHYWVMTDCDVSLFFEANGSRVSVRGRYEYDIQADGFPVLRKYVRSYWNETKDYRSESTHEFKLTESVVPDETFTLAGYGFPEADALLPQPKPAPRLWLWLALIGGACILIGVAARWWVRRGAAA